MGMSRHLTDLPKIWGWPPTGEDCVSPATLPGDNAIVWKMSGENRRIDPVLVYMVKL